MDNTNNFYSILNCSQLSTDEEIKTSYHELILKYHPDKNSSNANYFIAINNAWQTLRDSEKRKIYNAELLQKQFNEKPIIYEYLTVNDLTLDPDANIYHYPCRCGGLFVIGKNNLDNDCYVPCDECSLVVQLQKFVK